MNNLPFTTQYADVRSTCKGCSNTIQKQTLRLAAVVQSNFHDGKQFNWFHLKCFFEKQRPKTIGDIENLESLKYNDQKEIENLIENIQCAVLPSTSISKSSDTKNKKRPSNDAALKDFGIEYAVSGRSHCRGCLQKILKDDVRIKKISYESEVGMKYGGEPFWHHVDCFAKIRSTLGFFESGVKLPGYELLKVNDKQIVKKLIPVEDYIPEDKKPKTTLNKIETVEEKNIKAQNLQIFKYRNNLVKLPKTDVYNILRLNEQFVPSKMEKTLDLAADILTFGALSKCSKCKGQFELTKEGYICKGNLTEWAKCMTLIKEPPRIPCKITENLKSHKFLKNYTSIVTHRIIKYVPPSKTQATEEVVLTGPRVIREKPKLFNLEFVIFGKTEKTKEDIKKIITRMGGTLKTKLHTGTAAVISNADAVERMSKRMREIKDLGIHVVDDTYLDELENCDAINLLGTKSICDWGTDPPLRVTHEEEFKLKQSIYTKFVKRSLKLTLKDGCAVDPKSELQNVSHIYESNRVKYNAVLGLADIQSGKNSYYKLQLLEADHGSRYWVFQSWGRVGTTIGSHKIDTFHSANEAEHFFRDYYAAKSGNSWENQDNFVKVPGGYYPINIDYSDDTIRSLTEKNNSIPSKLEKSIEDLVKLLFDINLMRKTLLEFELDTTKMPLGKLSKKQIELAFKVLSKLSNLITNGGTESDFIVFSNQFYTLIPHSCGIELPPVINTTEMIKNKTEMLDSMTEIQVAYNLLNADVDESINPIDAHYAQLNTEMVTLDQNSDEYKMLVRYVETTHAETHRSFDLEVLDIFKVKRKGESERYKSFKNLHNRKLLWHGSRLTNFVGILSYGLKIAPPEVPSAGYMFGKGIYFADMVSKSANYCNTSPTDSTGLMLLCEVALGDMLELNKAKYIEKLPKNKHSTKGIGKTWPDPAGAFIREDGVEIPYGKPITEKIGSSLLYNEYIVYDVAQVNVQYLFKMNFKHK